MVPPIHSAGSGCGGEFSTVTPPMSTFPRDGGMTLDQVRIVRSVTISIRLLTIAVSAGAILLQVRGVPGCVHELEPLCDAIFPSATSPGTGRITAP